VRRQRTLDGEDRSATIPLGRWPSLGDAWSFFFFFVLFFVFFLFFLFSLRAPKATLSPPFHPHSWLSDCFTRVQVGCSRCSRCCHLIVDLYFQTTAHSVEQSPIDELRFQPHDGADSRLMERPG